MKWDYDDDGDGRVELAAHGLFVVNEGNFQYGNASLTFYDPTRDTVQNEVFMRANGMKLGDVAQSMNIYDNLGWIVVNNSHVIFAIDTETGREKGRIVNLTSPRYIHFVNPAKAYVTQLWDNRIAVVNPATYSVTGYIEVPDMTMQTGSTEQMVSFGPYVFCNCWSYQNRIIKIDTRTDSVVGSLTVGIQPASLVLDRNDNLWTLTDGGYEGSPYGHEAPALYCIDAHTFAVKKVFTFASDSNPSELCLNGDGDRLYWIDRDIWTMSVDAGALPHSPVVPYTGTRYYGLTVSPYTGDIYVADAIDYQQRGMIYRFDPSGRQLAKFYAGINPGAFCWK